jgi:hypothetical protein
LIGVWVYADPHRKVEVETNIHTYTIIKQAIRKIVKLKASEQTTNRGKS